MLVNPVCLLILMFFYLPILIAFFLGGFFRFVLDKCRYVWLLSIFPLLLSGYFGYIALFTNTGGSEGPAIYGIIFFAFGLASTICGIIMRTSK